MNARRFILLTGVITTLMAILVAGCSFTAPGNQVRTELITVVVYISQTPDPNVTPNVTVVTATPDRTQVSVPDGIAPVVRDNDDTTPEFDVTPLDNANGSAQGANTSDEGSALPDQCFPHIVEENDTVFGLADIYGVNPYLLLEVNGFTEDDAFLNIGDTLIIPLEDCPIQQLITPTATASQTPSPTVEVTEDPTEETQPTAEPSATPTATEPAETATPTPSPTITLAPTATNSEIEIVGVLRVGDVTAEGVRILNNGRMVNMLGWTLSDIEGNEYVFDELRIFQQAEHIVYTRSGQNGPLTSYWGLEEAVWQEGDIVTLTDADGRVQAIYRVTDTASTP